MQTPEIELTIEQALGLVDSSRRRALSLIGNVLCEIGKDPKAVKAWHRSLSYQSISPKSLAKGLQWIASDFPHGILTLKENEVSIRIDRAHMTLGLDLFTGTPEEIKAGLVERWTQIYEDEKEEAAQRDYRKFLALKSRFENPKGFDKKAKAAQDKADQEKLASLNKTLNEH